MRKYEVNMIDGVVLEVNAFNWLDAIRTAERKMAGYAFGATAIDAKKKKDA